MQEIKRNAGERVRATNAPKKVLIFVVCLNAEASIEKILQRIPQDIWKSEGFDAEVLIIDNEPSDETLYVASEYCRTYNEWNFTLLYNPKSQGYGGNQKLGFRYAIKKGFDAVVLLRGDGLYAPEYLSRMLQPILDGEVEASFGSRMIRRMRCLKEGMPLYKWAGNGVFTFIQNRILGVRLSEFHSGYRAYCVRTLAGLPFEHNSNHYDFDTDIIIQLLDTGKRIKEIAVPTFYSSDISVIKGFRYAMRAIRSCILSKVIRLGIYYHPKFDYEGESNSRYKEKFGYASSHQFALDQVNSGTTVLDLGCGPGFMADSLALKGVKTVSIDRQIQPRTRECSWKCVECDLDEYDYVDDFGKVDYILALDIVEHLKSPERLFRALRQRFSRDAARVIITTGNVAFVPIRASLLFAGFHYGSKGILDMDHARLFTFSSLRRVLDLIGYEVTDIIGLPAPFPLALGNGALARLLMLINRCLIYFSKSMFSYQIAVIARPLPTLEQMLEDAEEAGKKRLNNATCM